MQNLLTFCSKNINVFENALATTVNGFVIDKLVKLAMLWKSEPRITNDGWMSIKPSLIHLILLLLTVPTQNIYITVPLHYRLLFFFFFFFFFFLCVWNCCFMSLILLLLNTTCPVLANRVDPDQLASEEEANWSGSALFVIKYVNFDQKPGSSNLIGWKLEVAVVA